MRCPKCKKPIKEDTDGNEKYCQGHSIFDEPINPKLAEGKKMEKINLDNLVNRMPAIGQVNSFNRSAKYTVVNTAEVIKELEKAEFFPIAANSKHCRKVEKQAFTKHVVRFRHGSDLNKSEGEYIPEIALINSHDGSSAYKMMLGIFRIVCSNGLIVGSSTMEGLSFRHSGRDLSGRIADAASGMLKAAPLAFNTIDQWKGKDLSQEEKLRYASGAFNLYKGEADIKANIGSLLYSYRLADKGNDLWTVFNTVQEKFVNGGFYVQDPESLNFRHARKIKAIDRLVKLNTGLWNYTANFINN